MSDCDHDDVVRGDEMDDAVWEAPQDDAAGVVDEPGTEAQISDQPRRRGLDFGDKLLAEPGSFAIVEVSRGVKLRARVLVKSDSQCFKRSRAVANTSSAANVSASPSRYF